MNIIVRISGDKEEINKLKKLGSSLTDFGDAMRKVKTELRNYYMNNVFDSEGGALGDRWQSLSPTYKAYKGKHYPNRPILVRTGNLKKNVRGVSTKNSATIDNPTEYFSYLQLGTRRMPARPMLVVTPDAEKIVERIIDGDIKSKLKAVL